jgi:hypothetical protein
MDELKTLRQDIGGVAEAAGRMLKREKPLTHSDLTDLRDTLNHCADALQTVRDLASETCV